MIIVKVLLLGFLIQIEDFSIDFLNSFCFLFKHFISFLELSCMWPGYLVTRKLSNSCSFQYIIESSLFDMWVIINMSDGQSDYSPLSRISFFDFPLFYLDYLFSSKFTGYARVTRLIYLFFLVLQNELIHFSSKFK